MATITIDDDEQYLIYKGLCALYDMWKVDPRYEDQLKPVDKLMAKVMRSK